MEQEVKDLSLNLERDGFMRNLIRELSGLLEDVVGLEEASGFISVVGQNVGNEINQYYRTALKVSKLPKNKIADVLVDLKYRIKGDFYVIEADENKIVMGNRACPFAEKVVGRTSLCMMTSNVFGVISAENTGYAKVDIDKTIAKGDKECRIVVYFESNDEANGKEYFKSSSAE